MEGIQLHLEPSSSPLPKSEPTAVAGLKTQTFAAQLQSEQTIAPAQQRPEMAPQQSGAVQTTQAASDAPNETERRSKIAALVSEQILDGERSVSQPPLGAADNPEGWNSIGKRLAGHIRNCQTLLARRAYFSAREEAKMAIAHLMQTIDLHEGSYESEPSFAAAMTALHEAQDFTDSGAAHGNQTVSVIVGAHSSDTLKQYDVSGMSPLAAADYYRIAAADKLVAAAKNHPWASELYYTLGRVDQAQAESSDGTKQANLRWRAMTFYRAAAAINPSNAIALNQLGVIFLQMDRPRDASEALVEAVRLGTTPEAANNLVAASQKLGDAKLLAWAQQYSQPVRSPAPPQAQRNVVLVPSQAFATMNSPNLRRTAQPRANLPAQAVGYRR